MKKRSESGLQRDTRCDTRDKPSQAKTISVGSMDVDIIPLFAAHPHRLVWLVSGYSLNEKSRRICLTKHRSRRRSRSSVLRYIVEKE